MEMSARGFARKVMSKQRFTHLIGARVQGTGTASILAGSHEMTLVDNGTGDYTLTFSIPFKRVPVVTASTLTADSIIQVAAVSASAVQIKGFDATDGTTAKDILFHMIIMGFDSVDEI
jgi:hypothetical protein